MGTSANLVLNDGGGKQVVLRVHNDGFVHTMVANVGLAFADLAAMEKEGDIEAAVRALCSCGYTVAKGFDPFAYTVLVIGIDDGRWELEVYSRKDWQAWKESPGDLNHMRANGSLSFEI